jgi:hypothetical protein
VNFAYRPLLSLVTAMVITWTAFAGCTTTTAATLYTPITGIQISAADIATGHGCGTGSEQVYKYVAVLSYHMDACAFASGVFDCFADGIFSNLAADAGNQIFDVSIYAYNQASITPDGGGQNALQCLPNAVPKRDDAGKCPDSDVTAVRQCVASANWSATCTATQVQGVTTIAACGPLGPSDAGSRESDAATE